jgi:hypothetical protein
MYRTRDLIEAIYWKAQPTEGSPGEAIMAELLNRKRRNLGRAARPDPMKCVETSSSGQSEDEDMQGVSGPQEMTKASWEPWPDGADLETRMAYGSALMDGYGL